MGVPLPIPGSLKPVTPTDGVARELSQSTVERIWAKISLNDAGCWVWNGSRTAGGYGRTSVGGAYMYTHRLMLMAFGSSIPAGWHTDHLCRNRACCNPEHLEAVTAAENIHRSPIAMAALNSRKTHCPQGHEYTPENTIKTRNQRVCRACFRPPGHGKGGRTCRRGHEYTDANTYIDPRGRRDCRACIAFRQRLKDAERAGASSTSAASELNA